MGKNPAFSLGWGELEKLGNFKCKWKQASLNEPEEFMLVDVDGFSLRCVLGGWVVNDTDLSRSTGVVSLVSWGRVRGSPIL